MDVFDTTRKINQFFMLWLTCVFDPNRTLNTLKRRSSRERITEEVIKLWVCSSVIGALISWPAQRLYGIQWNDLGFQIPALFVTDLTILSGGVTLYFSMKIHRLRSSFWNTVEAYVVVASAYTPFINLLNIPALIKRLSFEHLQLENHVPVIEAFQDFLTPNNTTKIMLQGSVAVALSELIQLLSFFYLVILAEYIIRTNDMERPKVYSALALAMTMSAIFTVILISPFAFLNEYSSISTK